MPVTFAITRCGLVVVRYIGRVTGSDSIRALGRYAVHPRRVPGQPHLIDLSALTEYATTPVEMMKVQAKKADILSACAPQTLMVYYAPRAIGLCLARATQRSWDGLSVLIPRIVQSEDEALALVGSTARTLDEVLARV